MNHSPLIMPQSGLYAITDNALILEKNFLFVLEQALKTGVKLLQYRDKSQNKTLRFTQARQLQRLCHVYGVPLIINDDIALAKAVNADGVHLGKEDASLSQARQLLGEQAIIGISCYQSLEYAVAMQQQGASYVAFGRFFPSRTKPQALPAPFDLLSRARQQLSLPIVAIGGITVDNGPQLIKAGAQLLAVVHGIFAQPEQIPITVQRYVDLFK
jgi:thiamine-phosphate pyrophosphorylase